MAQASRKDKARALRQRGAGLGAVLAVLFLAIGFVVGQAGLVTWNVRAWPWLEIGGVAASFGFGALVGLSEILTRYRDEPLHA